MKEGARSATARNGRRAPSPFSAAFASAVRERLLCRAELLGTGAFIVLLLFVFSRLWQAVAGADGRVGEWTVSQLVLYLLVAEVVTMAPGFVHARVAEDARSGQVAARLLRPGSWLTFELGRALGAACVRALVVVAFGAPAAFLLAGVPDARPVGLVLGLLLLVPAAIVLETCARLVLGLAAFWVEDSNPLYWVWQKATFALGGLMLPLDFYPDWLRDALAWLPFRALLYGPARTVVAFDGRAFLHDAALLAAWTAAFLALAAFVWWRALARIQEQGD